MMHGLNVADFDTEEWRRTAKDFCIDAGPATLAEVFWHDLRGFEWDAHSDRAVGQLRCLRSATALREYVHDERSNKDAADGGFDYTY